MAEGKFLVGITRDNLRPDGSTIFDPACLELLNHPRITWEFLPELEAEISPATAARYDALCVMMARVTRASLSGPERRLKLVARFGVGYDTVDVAACTEQGVILTISPEGVRRPMATAALTLVLMLAQKIMTKDRLTREGRWAERVLHFGTGLTGRVLGSIGVGNIGSELFRLAAPFAMRHLACDPYVTPQAVAPLGVGLVDLDTLFREADFLCVNCPLTEETRHLVNARRLALMKPTAYLVNTARGPIVDEKALHGVLAAGAIAGAGIDVFEQEPVAADNPLLGLGNIIVTPHHVGLTDECINTIAAAVFSSCRELAAGKSPRNVVNQQVLGRVPHYFHA